MLSEPLRRLHAVSFFPFSFSRDDSAQQPHALRSCSLTGPVNNQEALDASLLVLRTISLLHSFCFCFVFLFMASKQYFTAPVKLLITFWHLFMVALKLILRAIALLTGILQTLFWRRKTLCTSLLLLECKPNNRTRVPRHTSMFSVCLSMYGRLLDSRMGMKEK